MSDDRPTFGSLFAGIGGIDLGLERAGWRGRWQVEYEPFCQRVLAKHWPDVPRYGDIHDVDWSLVEPVDLVAGGFPCQPVSTAGRRLIQDDDRWLWPEFARCLRALRPRYVLVENVPGLLVGGGMDDVLGELADIGYDTEWESIPASAVGAPHLRYRVWIVAYAYGLGPRRPSALGPQSVTRLRPEDSSAEPHGPDYRAGADANGTRNGHVAISSGQRLQEPGRMGSAKHPEAGGARAPDHALDAGWWSTEPDVGGSLDGFPAWLDRRRERLVTPHMLDLANAYEGGPREALRAVRSAADQAAVRGPAGGSDGVPPSAVLLAYLRELEDHVDEGRLSLARPEAPESGVRGVRENEGAARPSRQRRPSGQRSGQPADPLHALSQLLARDAGQAWAAYRREDAELVLSRWAPGWEDGIARVATGVPARVDRLRSLGNAVVPQVVEWIGRRILEAEVNDA